jgi:hypothetical protein
MTYQLIYEYWFCQTNWLTDINYVVTAVIYWYLKIYCVIPTET